MKHFKAVLSACLLISLCSYATGDDDGFCSTDKQEDCAGDEKNTVWTDEETGPKYHLTYFQAKAIAEPIRLLLSYGNIDFEDTRVTLEEWPKMKWSQPLASLPTLKMEGKVYYQSIALARYLGKKFGLGGKNDLENLEIDIAVDNMNDLRAKLAAAAYEENEASKEKKYKDLTESVIPFFAKKLEADAAANNGHMALGRLTWADFYCAGLIDYVSHIARQDLLTISPNLKAVKDKVLALPAIQAWYAKAPKTDY